MFLAGPSLDSKFLASMARDSLLYPADSYKASTIQRVPLPYAWHKRSIGRRQSISKHLGPLKGGNKTFASEIMVLECKDASKL